MTQFADLLTMQDARLVPPVVSLAGVTLRYRKTLALDDVTLDLPAGCMVGLIGPDGVGKSSLLSLVAGARALQDGAVHVLGSDMSDRRARAAVGPRIAYMPQGLGRNLYPTLSIEENLQFFGRLFGHDAAERRRRIDALTASTGLRPFLSRPAGKLSGGMKQKLALCCALIHDPDLLILDDWGLEPLDAGARHDLLEILEDRYGHRSTIVTSQLPVDQWHLLIGDPTYADAVLDRLVHNAHRLDLTGESLRRTRQSARKT